MFQRVLLLVTLVKLVLQIVLPNSGKTFVRFFFSQKKKLHRTSLRNERDESGC